MIKTNVSIVQGEFMALRSAVVHGLPAITAEAPEGHIALSCEAAVTFEETPVTANAVPNPAASLDSPDKGTQERDANGDPPKPRFNMSAYNGGPMMVSGYRFPVVVDGTGIKAAAARLPIYVGHVQAYEGMATHMEQLLGQTDQFTVDQATGKICASGPITGESETVKNARIHAKNGFQWQASINAHPSQIEFIQEGVTAKVNGRQINGPCCVARAATLDHIALVPLGADTSTTASIAAAAAKGPEMEFKAWLKAKYGVEDASVLTAQQKTAYEAEFKTISAGTTAPAPTPAPTPAPAPITASATDDINATITARRKALADEDDRIAKVRDAAKDHPTIAAQAVRDGWSVDKTEVEVMRAERNARQTAGQSYGHSPVNQDAISAAFKQQGAKMPINLPVREGGRYEPRGGSITDHTCRIIEAACLMSCGSSKSAHMAWDERLARDPQYGEVTVTAAHEFRRKFGSSMGPLGLMKIVARMSGMGYIPDSPVEAYEAITHGGSISAEFTTFSLPVILSNLMNKLLMDGYNSVDPDVGTDGGGTAWQKFVRRGPVNDFKPHYRVRLVGNWQPKPLGPGGEIQHGHIGEQSYQIAAAVKALMMGIPYQAVINDDMQVLSTIPTGAGVGCGEQVAKDVYTALLANVQSDGSTAFFTDTAGNTAANAKILASMAANLIYSNALSYAGLNTAFIQFMKQTKPNGEPLGAVPSIHLVPLELQNLAMQLNTSKDLIAALVTTGGAQGAGVPSASAAHKFQKVVCSTYLSNPTITGYSTDSGYLMTAATDVVYAQEVAFLNGQEMPVVERDEMSFDRLGIGFRWWLSYGTAMSEPRAALKYTASAKG